MYHFELLTFCLIFLFQHLDEATILEEAKNLDMEKSLEILKSHGTVQVYFIVCLCLLDIIEHCRG